jgi:hypothetical protein
MNLEKLKFLITNFIDAFRVLPFLQEYPHVKKVLYTTPTEVARRLCQVCSFLSPLLAQAAARKCLHRSYQYLKVKCQI